MLKRLSVVLLLTSLQAVVAAKKPTGAELCPGEDRLTCLWRQKLPQAFVDEWIETLSQKSGRGLPIEAEIETGIDAILENHAILFTPEQDEIVAKLPKTPLYGKLKAWASFRRGLAAKEAMELLPKGHPWRGPLARTLTLAMARAGKVKDAIRILREEMEAVRKPWPDPRAMAPYALQLARFQYQFGDLDEAEKWYGLVPAHTPEYLKAQEELLWVWLRETKTEKLRGLLETLTLPIFADKFAPEIYVVRAVSNLKLCHYEDAKKDFDTFSEVNLKWAKPMEEAPRVAQPQRPPELDWYTTLVVKAIESRAKEAEQIKALGWSEPLKTVAANQQWLETVRVREYRRQWRNASTSLREAIIKMKFVKVELRQEIIDAVAITEETKHRQMARQNMQASLASELEGKDMVFPFDGTVWPDELFRLRSNAFNGCL